MESRPKESVVRRDSLSQENFQRCLYELFEKNGILSNLRAHLRSKIVEVLKTEQSGKSLPAQKHFTQRLELPHQALNILIVEHLISMEFNYTLSVFVSEIPLANMVFDYAKTLFDGADNKYEGSKHQERFKENDIWSIINSLGMKCDSDFANNVLEMYQEEQNTSLLMCILKYMSYNNRSKDNFDANYADDQSSTISSQSSVRINTGTRDFLQQYLIPPYNRDSSCKHLSSCNECKKRMQKFKKKTLEKKEKGSSTMSLECFMRSVEVAENHVMEEMFEHVKAVYEAEVEMFKTEEEKRLKRSLINHAKLLKQRRDEMEANFKEREAELFRNVNQKKKFLWGLATTLRTQHEQMSRSMMDVRRQTELLAEKEDNLRAQLIDAEKSLKTRGEEMRAQISNELQTLERHLDSLKMEREKINDERTELEQLKNVCEKAEKIASQEHLNAKHSCNFDVLKNEIATLKHYLENTKPPKCYVESATLTDNIDMTSDSVLNNEQSDRNSENDGRSGKLNQVVNDLKKPKNVNFCQETLGDVYRELLTSASSTTDAVDKLKIENEQLKTIAKQQKDQIESLVRQQEELQARVARLSLRENSLWRPRTAPPSLNLNNRTATFGPHKGAGEELSTMFLAVQRRVYNVGEPIPFITGIEKRTESRKYLMSQYRKLRRLSPTSTKQDSRTSNKPSTSHDHGSVILGKTSDSKDQLDERPPNIKQDSTARRQKSPKSILREAKENLRNKDRVKQCNTSPLHISPSSVLREAKLRLRKLKLQAEAVEKSYQNFRRRNDTDDDNIGKPISSNENINVDYIRINDAYVHSKEALESLHQDYNKYLSQTTLNLGNNYKNQNTASHPLHTSQVTQYDNKKTKENYLDIPMSEFRKLYSGFDKISDKNYNTSNIVDFRNDNTNLQDKCKTNNPNTNDKDNTDIVHELDSEKNDYLQESCLSENNAHVQQDFDNVNAQETNSKEHDIESNPSVSRDLTQKTDLKTSLSDKEIQLILKNKLNIDDNKNDIQPEHSEINKPVNGKQETDPNKDYEANSKYSELSTNNLLRVEINPVSETEKSIKSSKLLVVVKSTLNSDTNEKQVAIVSPNYTEQSEIYTNVFDQDLSVGVKSDVLASGEGIQSEMYSNMFDQDLSVGGVKDDVLANSKGDDQSEHLNDITNVPSEYTEPLSDDDNFFDS